MRLKCFFCQQPLFMLHSSDPDYNHYEIFWDCRNHPKVVLVRHIVDITVKRIISHEPPNNSGDIRKWIDTVVVYKHNRRNFQAHWERFGFTFNVYKSGNYRNELFQKYPGGAIFTLQHFPKDITPENIVKKVSLYMNFS